MATERTVYFTCYGWPDNDPPGSAAIAYPRNDGYPTIHNRADGIGTYANPITLATDPRELPVGGRVYVPDLRKYFMMEDLCVTAQREWSRNQRWHFDIWVGGEGYDEDFVIRREEDLTRNYDVIIDPAATLPVDTTPLLGGSPIPDDDPEPDPEPPDDPEPDPDPEPTDEDAAIVRAARAFVQALRDLQEAVG